MRATMRFLAMPGVMMTGFASAGACGDHEKGVSVYAGDGAGGAKNAFSDAVFGARLEGAGPSARLWLTVSGERCGKARAADFVSENFCERYVEWNRATQRFDYAAAGTARAIQ